MSKITALLLGSPFFSGLFLSASDSLHLSEESIRLTLLLSRKPLGGKKNLVTEALCERFGESIHRILIGELNQQFAFSTNLKLAMSFYHRRNL
jgi:hypothetical protein